MINSKEGLYESLYEQIIVKKNQFGVCLGMQLFMNKSDEGKKDLDGLMVKLKDFKK